jgi:hypothetical protein
MPALLQAIKLLLLLVQCAATALFIKASSVMVLISEATHVQQLSLAQVTPAVL